MPPDTQMELTRFSPTDAAIAELAREYLPLQISGLDDKAGYETVHQARMDVKGKRVLVEKTRKELKADAIAFGREVDTEAKRLTALLEPIEQHLLTQEKAIDDEKERIKNADRLKAEAEARAKAEAEAAERKAVQEAEDTRLRAEQEKIDAGHRALEEARERLAATQKAAQYKLDIERREVEAEKKRLADIETARVRAEEMERAKAVAAEKARVAEQERIARVTAEQVAAEKARAEAEEAARLKAEALRPDCDKLLAVAKAVGAIEIPRVSAAALTSRAQVQDALADASREVRRIVEEMV